VEPKVLSTISHVHAEYPRRGRARRACQCGGAAAVFWRKPQRPVRRDVL